MNRALLKVAVILLTSSITFVLASNLEAPFSPAIPKTWDEAALTEWATPVAGLNLRPTHLSAKEYYSMPVENLRTYPVYFPGREPEGYWEMLQRVGPKPLIEPEKLKSVSDWIEAGRIVFEEVDDLHLRTTAPELIAKARDPKQYEGRQPLPDGTVSDLRWIPTKNGVALSIPNCRSCHLQYLPDGARVPGAPTFSKPGLGSGGRSGLVRPIQTALRSVTGAPPFLMGPESFGIWLYQAYGVPWRKDDIHERVKAMSEAEYNLWINAAVRGGGVPRWNGSPYYSAKMPDLIGIAGIIFTTDPSQAWKSCSIRIS